MKWVIYFIIIALVVVFHQSVIVLLEFGRFSPDLILLFILAIVWSFNNVDYIFFAILGGLWLETSAGLPVGSMILGLFFVGYIAQILINRWFFTEKSWQYIFIAVTVGSIFLHLWTWAYSNLLFIFNFHSFQLSFIATAQGLLPTIIMNLLLTYPVFIIIEFIAKRLNSRSGYLIN